MTSLIFGSLLTASLKFLQIVITVTGPYFFEFHFYHYYIIFKGLKIKMSKVNGIYAATMSIFGNDLSLNVKKTIEHGENLIKQGCHGVVFFGSTGQSQLIQISEKLNCINELSKSNFKNQFILGTGLNSLNETINLMKISITLGFKRFLIMPPAYYKYTCLLYTSPSPRD